MVYGFAPDACFIEWRTKGEAIFGHVNKPLQILNNANYIHVFCMNKYEIRVLHFFVGITTFVVQFVCIVSDQVFASA
jgi:hypothetical protein